MCTFLRARAFLASLSLGVSLVAFCAPPVIAGPHDQPKRAGGPGRKLFNRVWEPNPDAESAGDGLGPLFNERSCVACHFQGGVGGAGPNENNVRLLTIAPQKRDATVQALPNQPAEPKPTLPNLLHRGFGQSVTVVLHRYSTRGAAYQTFLDNLIGLDPQAALDPARQAGLRRTVIYHDQQGPGRVIEVEGTVLQLAERNTPALFGAGLISLIPKAEIEKVAQEQAKSRRGVHGRFVGRFGWRGQTMYLNDFIRGACAVELGLQVKDHPQAVDPSLPPAEQIGRKIPRKKVDLTEHQCDQMTDFVFHLPPPRQSKPAGLADAASIRHGSQAFESVGCAECHRPSLATVNGIYSDLLVHDMGLALIDPSPAPLGPPGSSSNPSITYYGGGAIFTQEQLAARQHWKTPPLWGLHDSGPYLHDGRAQTIEEAILAHGGEADNSVRSYRSLSAHEQQQLLRFLDTLAAPDRARLPRPPEVRLPLAVR